jgi:hypothetical protein
MLNATKGNAPGAGFDVNAGTEKRAACANPHLKVIAAVLTHHSGRNGPVDRLCVTERKKGFKAERGRSAARYTGCHFWMQYSGTG